MCHGGPLYTVSSLTTCLNLQKQSDLTNHGHSEDVMYMKFATHEDILILLKNIINVKKKKLKTLCKSMIQVPLQKKKTLDVIVKFDSK